MANNLLTPTVITREALALFVNSNAFIKKVPRQYDDRFANAGAKIGTTLSIRNQNDYVVRSGPTAVPQSTNETAQPLVVATQKGVDMAFSSLDYTLTIDDFSDRYLKPAMNNLTAKVASDIIGGLVKVPNIVHAVDGSGNTISPGFDEWATAGAVLDTRNAPRDGNRFVVVDPITQARTLSAFKGLFNNQQKVGEQYTRGMMGTDVLGFDWMMDQSIPAHKEAAYGTLPTVNGANQTGSALTVTVTTAPINQGDIIQVAGVNAVNRTNKLTTGLPMQFAVTAFVPAGSTVIPIYPPIVGPGVGGADAAGMTVDALPANGAVISAPIKAGETYRSNLAFHSDAVTMVTADLILPQGVHQAARETYDGVSMRMVTAFDVISDQLITRFDVVYGYAWIRPEWAVIVPDRL